MLCRTNVLVPCANVYVTQCFGVHSVLSSCSSLVQLLSTLKLESLPVGDQDLGAFKWRGRNSQLLPMLTLKYIL